MWEGMAGENNSVHITADGGGVPVGKKPEFLFLEGTFVFIILLYIWGGSEEQQQVISRLYICNYILNSDNLFITSLDKSSICTSDTSPCSQP